MARARLLRWLPSRRSIRAQVLLAFALPCFTACAEKSDPPSSPSSPPIRVVRAGFGDLEGLRATINLFVQACRIGNNLPFAPTQYPSDSTLAKVAIFEEEELFDGRMWASYQTDRQFGADPSQGCRLTIFVRRWAKVERTCESGMRGWNEDLMEHPDRSNAPPTIVEEELSSISCKEKRRPPHNEGIPSEDAGGGARCQWTSEVVGRMLGASREKNDESFDTCLYEKVPDYYYYQGNTRPVILKTRGGTRSVAGNDLAKRHGEYAAAVNHQLMEFSDGTPIPASRFTKVAVEAFLKLPAKTAVGAP